MTSNLIFTAASGDDRSVPERVRILAGAVVLEGELEIPVGASGLVLFAHGSGSSRHSPRNRLVADLLRRRGLGTLLFDLMTLEEEAGERAGGRLRFDIGLLADRLVQATEWVAAQPRALGLRFGYFGASTGAAAALVAAARLGSAVGAVVSRGGRVDLAASILPEVRAPTLLIVGGYDEAVMEWNERVLSQLPCEKDLRVVPGATHLFEEPGKLEEVGRLSADWFVRHLGREAPPAR